MGSSASSGVRPEMSQPRSTVSNVTSTDFQEVQFRHSEGEDGNCNAANAHGQHGHGHGGSPRKAKTLVRGAATGSRRQDAASPDNVPAKRTNENTHLQGKGPDFYSVVDDMQRQEAATSAFETPTYLNPDELALETFFHISGREYTCMYQSGRRYYMDSWKTQNWLPFPSSWLKEGLIVTTSILENETQSKSPSAGPPTDAFTRSPKTEDDREGHFEHPSKGKLETYIFEEKRNGHYFYDKANGIWVHLPISWELHSPLICKLLAPIEEALPNWKDRYDMLASLRASNYNPQDCIATYLATDEEDGASAVRTPHDGELQKVLIEKDAITDGLESEVKRLTLQLERVTHKLSSEEGTRAAAEGRVTTLEEQMSSLRLEVRTSKLQLTSLQQSRPHSGVKGKPTKHVIPKIQPEKPALDPKLMARLNECTRSLRAEQLKLRREAGKWFSELQPMFIELAKHLKGAFISKVDQTAELTDLRHRYQSEALQRKLLYNKLQELRGNIRVFARCRKDEKVTCCFNFPSDREVAPPGGRKTIKFDKVFTPASTQEEVFADTLPIITSCVDGYNVCIMAYGQTNSGKTHTMQGQAADPGVNVRSIKALLKICKERENVEYQMKTSMVEIYNETIQDLLSSDAKTLELRVHGNNVLLPGQTEMAVRCIDDITTVVNIGEKNRRVASTKMNSQSSRSHLIFKITVVGHDKISGAISTGTLTLCDLAGSERVGKSEATGQRLVEAAAINKSLSALGQVFKSLRTSQLHIPYRNSKLTHILQPSLGGDAKACLFVMISPDDSNMSESLSSLEFGTNARHIQLGQAKKNIQKAPQAAADSEAPG